MKESSVKTKVSDFYTDVLHGLTSKQKYLPSKYFYDETGSDLFEQICQLDEYYPTGCEVSIMKNEINEIRDVMGEQVQLIELGSGSSMKTRLLIDSCKNLDMYVPVDISGTFLQTAAERLRSDYPNLDIQPVVADYTSSFRIPKSNNARKRVIYFPGSTIGNFTQARASAFLDTIGSILKTGDGLLIGVDLKKEVGVLEAAYNDSKGVTAAFNKNILARINNEIGADIDLSMFQHRAFYNAREGRIEMHLESLEHQIVHIDDTQIEFKEGETIHTENSYKYTVDEFDDIAGDYFNRLKTWTDENDYFSVHYFERV